MRYIFDESEIFDDVFFFSTMWKFTEIFILFATIFFFFFYEKEFFTSGK